MDEPVDAPRARVAQQRDLRGGELGRIEHTRVNRIVDIVVDVGDGVDERTILPSSVSGGVGPECCRIPSRTSYARFNPLPSLSSTSTIRRDCSLWRNVRPFRSARSDERRLTRVPERRVPDVVPQADRLDQILVQPERPRDPVRAICVTSRVCVSRVR